MIRKTKINGSFFITLLFTVIAMFFSIVVLSSIDNYSRVLSPVKGVLDLSSVEMNDNIPLGGEWIFFDNKFLDPDFIDPLSGKAVGIPHLWNKTGYGTYYLKIKGLENDKKYYIYVPDVTTSYRLYVNSELVSENGIPGKDYDSEYVYIKPQLLPFIPGGDSAELIMQISNFHRYPGGFNSIIRLGLYDKIISEYILKIIIQMVLFGGLLIISLYNLSLFLLNPSDRSSLYYSIFNMLISFRILVTGEKVLNILISNINWYFLLKIQFISGALLLLFLLKFMKSLFKDIIKTKISNLLVICSLLYAIIPILVPIRHLALFDKSFFVLSVICFIYLIAVLIKAISRNIQGAVFALTGILFLSAALFLDFIFPPGSNVIPLGIFIFTIFQLLVVAEKHYLTEEQNKILQHVVNRDGMTNLYKREHFKNIVTSIIDNDNPIVSHAMMFIDIDDFKKVNDTYGHDAGDEIIITVAQNILNSMRYSDIACRYGGDEFVLWLHNTTLEDAEMIAERIIRNLSEPVKYEGQDIYISVSIGAGFYPDEGITFEDLSRKCDQRMYSVKRKGKNSYCLK